jgi:hypothetical protein
VSATERVTTSSPARAALDATISEKDFSQTVVDYAHKRGWLAYHSYRSTRSEYGYPDWTFVRADRLIFAELKTERGRLSATQRVWLFALAAMAEHALGVGVYIWRPSSWPVIERLLA